MRATARQVVFSRPVALLAGAALALAAIVPAAAANAGPIPPTHQVVALGVRAHERARGTSATITGGGLIAFRDAQGIGVIDPRSGRQRLLFALPSACTTSSSGIPDISLAGPVWVSPHHGAPELYFWLTDFQLTASARCRLPLPPRMLSEAALLVQADPRTGALRVVAVAPGGLPCQPGSDLAAVPAALAFTDGGCDETSLEALALPLHAGEEPLQPGKAVLPAGFCHTCAINARLLGSGPDGTVLFEELGLQTATPPPPSLQLLDASSGAVRLLSPLPPPALRPMLAAAVTSPNGYEVAFAAGSSGVGVLDLRTGAWAAEPVPACAGTCAGALSVAFSPSGAQLAIATGGEIVIDPLSGSGSPELLLRHSGVSELSWSGSIGGATLGSATPPPSPAGALDSIWAPFVASGSGASRIWQVGPSLPAGLPSLLVSLPGTPSALLSVSDEVALAAGSGGAMWRSTDGGRSWTVVTAHCAELQMVTEDYPPCHVSQMARLAGGVVLAGGALGVWRSVDGGRHWQREAFHAGVVQGGPWTSGSEALVLVAPAGPSGAPLPGASSSTLLASSDGGRSWHALLTVPRRDPDPGAQAASFDQLYVLGAGRLAELYRVGDCSLPADLRVSTDDGRQWRSLPVGPLVAPGALSEAGPSRLVLGSAFCKSAAPRYGQGIFAHPVAGAGGWSATGLPTGYAALGGRGPSRFPVSSPVEPFSIDALSFPTGAEGIAVGSQVATVTDGAGVPAGDPSSSGQGLIFLSSDGGSTWSSTPDPGSSPLSLLSCTGATLCLAGSTDSNELVLLSPDRRPASG